MSFIYKEVQTMLNLELLTKQVVNVSRTTGNFLKTEIKKIGESDIQTKGLNNFVTYVDKTTEQKLVADLHLLLPEAGFIAEENQSLQRKEIFNWIVDPLDGTTNFIHHVPLYSMSIALMERNNVILGVVYEPNLQECFYAWKNGGAYLNGHKISVSKIRTLKDSLLATGFPYYDYGKLDEYIVLFKYLMENTHGLRRLGSAAVDLAYCACGRFEGFYEYGLSPWDVAAGAIIVQEAGGLVSDFTGGNNYIFGGELVSGNPFIYDEFMQVIKSHFIR
jgi:myo-inositol-1(or 4)-monophosphatase